MRMVVAVALAGLLVVGLSGVVAWAPAYYTGTHTEHCPLGHKLTEDSQCVILDREPSRTLVQHANRATGERYLEIVRSDGRTRRYEVPDAAEGLAPEGYTANLLRGETEWVAIDRTWEALTPLP